jgi:hypothetical protein
MKQSIRVIPDDPWNKMDEMSRLNYGKIYTVEHNVKAASFGQVMPEDHYLLEASFKDVWFSSSLSPPIPPPLHSTTTMQPRQQEQVFLAGIGEHSQLNQPQTFQNTNIDADLATNSMYQSSSANPSLMESSYDDGNKSKDREVDYSAVDDSSYPPNPQYIPHSTDPRPPRAPSYGHMTPTQPGYFGAPQPPLSRDFQPPYGNKRAGKQRGTRK